MKRLKERYEDWGVIQQAYQAEMIQNGDVWIQMMLDRNAMSHLYDEEKSREIYNNIKEKYLVQLEELKNFLAPKI